MSSTQLTEELKNLGFPNLKGNKKSNSKCFSKEKLLCDYAYRRRKIFVLSITRFDLRGTAIVYSINRFDEKSS